MQQEDSSVEAWMSIVGAYKTVHVLLNQQLIKNGLTFPQYRVIRVLGKFGAMPMNKVGEHMLVTPPDITGLIDRLEGRGYIERKESGTDRRVAMMRLTRRGEALHRRTSVQHRKLVSRIMKALSGKELVNLTRLLHRIREAALEFKSGTQNESG
mgnify:CR=1 FL=1